MGKYAHGDTHPEKLGGFQANRYISGLVDHKVAVVKGLDAKVVEIQVSRWVDGIRQFGNIKLEQFTVQALDFHPTLEVLLETFRVKSFKLINAVGCNIPTQYFLVNIGK